MSGTIDFHVHIVRFAELSDDEVEITVARCQYRDIDFACTFDHVERDPDVPVTFGRTISSLNKGFQLHLKADGLQDLLKLPLLRVTAINRIRKRADEFSAAGDLIPKRLIIKVAAVRFSDRVVDVLNIHEDRDFVHDPCFLTHVAVVVSFGRRAVAGRLRL